MGEIEQVILQLITTSGFARSCAFEALETARNNEFKKADHHIETAKKKILEAHKVQTSLIQKESSKYKSDISIEKDGQIYNGKSIMGILSMGSSRGDALAITVEGIDEKEALGALKKLFESNFGE